MAIHKIGGKTFVVDRDIYDVTPISVIDDDWELIDKSGHLHRWQNGKLPSLVKIIDCPPDDEYPSSSHFVCKQCGESITPSYKSPEYREWAVVNTHYLIDGLEVPKEEFESRQPH
jgi:hypothetical protein